MTVSSPFCPTLRRARMTASGSASRVRPRVSKRFSSALQRQIASSEDMADAVERTPDLRQIAVVVVADEPLIVG